MIKSTCNLQNQQKYKIMSDERYDMRT